MKSTSEIAQELKVHPATLTRWRALGLPATAYQRYPGGFAYDEEQVRRWLLDPHCPAHKTTRRLLS